MIEIIKLTKKDLYKFSKFIDGFPFTSESIWIGASISNIPCGILMASKDFEEPSTCNINTLFVVEPLRREGIGNLLIKTFIRECLNLKYKNITFNSVANKEVIAELNLFLKNYGFTPVEIVAINYTFNDPDSILNCKFVKQALSSNLTPPKGIKIIPLNKVDSKLIDYNKARKGIDYPDYYALFPDDACSKLKHINTFVAVAHEKEIIGWLTALDVYGKSIYYKTFYVKDDYKRFAIGLFLMGYCIKNHAKKYKNVPAIFGTSLKNPNADKFHEIYFKGVKKEVSYEFITKRPCL